MSDDGKRKIEVSLDDLNTPEIDARVQEIRTAGQPQLIQSLGLPSSAFKAPGVSGAPKVSGGWLRGNTVSLGVAGLVGGALGWAMAEFLASPEARDRVDYFWTAVWTALFALGVGAALSMWEGLQLKSSSKAIVAAKRALPIAVVGGVVGGLVAQKIYGGIIESAIRDALRDAINGDGSIDDALESLKSTVHVARTIGFGLLGGCVGAALGFSSLAKQRIVNGVIGGVAGGCVGGFLFDFIDVGSGVVSRLVALTVTGLVIGVAIGLVESVRKEFWLQIVSGGMAGKQFIIYHEATSIGSGPECHITLIKDPSISPVHVWLARTPRGVALRTASAQPMTVNGAPTAEAILTDGDMLQIGQTLLRFGEKEPTVVMPGPLQR